MLYRIVRILIFIILIVLALILIKRGKIARKRLNIVIIIVCYSILFSIDSVLPVENLFINFESPEDVFNYSCIGKIQDIVYGENSCMVVYSTGSSSYSYSFMSKSSTGYKISNFFSGKTVMHSLDKDGSFTVYNVLGTNDFYIFGSTFSKDKEINIVDKNDKKVKYIVEKPNGSDTKTIFLYTFVDDFTTEYYLLINENKILLSN